MKINNIFQASQEGTFKDFLNFYTGDVNLISSEKLNLLMMVLTSDTLLNEKIKIIKFLIAEGVDINYQDSDGRNVLHNFFQFKANWRPNLSYAIQVIYLLLNAGVGVNTKDNYGSIPLSYAITVLKLPTEEALPIYKLLLKYGSNPLIKNNSGKSSLDYAREFSWRNDLIPLLEAYNEK